MSWSDRELRFDLAASLRQAADALDQGWAFADVFDAVLCNLGETEARLRALQGAPEAEPTGGAQRLGKNTSNVSVPTHGEGGTHGK